MPIQFKTNNGYMSLDAWLLANVIQLCTVEFCDLYVSGDQRYRLGKATGRDGKTQYLLFDPTGRQYDQMTQAARSCTANIAEGYSRHQTSTATEMQLLDVARASLEELKGDFYFFLLKAHTQPLARNSQEYVGINAVNVVSPTYHYDWDVESVIVIEELKNQFQKWTTDSITYARMLYVLCSRCAKMVERLLASRLEQFKQQGGFTENLTKERVATQTQQALDQGTPTCPLCGKPMIKRYYKRGTKAGQSFWGCSAYPACEGTRRMG